MKQYIVLSKGTMMHRKNCCIYYDAYISALSTMVEICSDGTEHQYVCEDQKAEIQTKYLEALSKCKVIK